MIITIGAIITALWALFWLIIAVMADEEDFFVIGFVGCVVIMVTTAIIYNALLPAVHVAAEAVK